MRNVISTNAHVDVTDEYAKAVDKILNDPFRTLERSTFQTEDGQEDFYIHVVEYGAPDGNGTRWAVDYSDPASREVEESLSRSEAEARYEELVRASANNLSLDDEGEPIPFTSTDVPGVPGYTG